MTPPTLPPSQMVAGAQKNSGGGGVSVQATLPTAARPVVLSLCDRTGNILRPWAATGQYRCIAVDNWRHDSYTDPDTGIEYVAADVLRYLPPRAEYAFACAFPPCTHLATSGARWMADKGLAALAGALAIVDRCRELLEWTGAPWLLENPVSTISTYWREPDHRFDPYEFAGYPGGESDDYTKRTCLWVGGGFRMPATLPVWPAQGSKMHRLPPSDDRADLRSETPMGFARAVFQANCILAGMTPTTPTTTQEPERGQEVFV